eukprot:g5660.t1
MAQGMKMGDVRKLAEGVELSQKLLETYPTSDFCTSGAVHSLIGDFYQALNDEKYLLSSIDAYREALNRVGWPPGSSPDLHRLDNLSTLQKDFVKTLLFNMGVLYLRIGHKREAIDVLEIYNRIWSDDLEVVSMVGRAKIEIAKNQAEDEDAIDFLIGALETYEASEVVEWKKLNDISKARYSVARTIQLDSCLNCGKWEGLPDKYRADKQFEVGTTYAMQAYKLLRLSHGVDCSKLSLLRLQDSPTKLRRLVGLKSVQRINVENGGVMDDNLPFHFSQYGNPYPRNLSAKPSLNRLQYNWPFTLRYTERQSVLVTLENVLVVGDTGLVVHAKTGSVYFDSFGAQRKYSEIVEIFETDHEAFLYGVGSKKADNSRWSKLRCAASLLSPHSLTYFHWIVAALPRIILLIPILKNRPECKLLVPVFARNGAKTGLSFITQSLDMLSTESELDFIKKQIMYYPITNDKMKAYHEKIGTVLPIEELLLVEWKHHPDNSLPEFHVAHLPPRAVLLAARNYFNNSFKKKKKHTLIWLSRGRSTVKNDKIKTGRRFKNEVELIHQVRKLLQLSQYKKLKIKFQLYADARLQVKKTEEKLLRWRKHTTNSFSFKDTVELFREASIIIGIHGAGLSNMIFTPPGAHVLEVSLPQFHAHYFANMAAALDHVYWQVPLGDKYRFAYAGYDVDVNKKQFLQVVRQILDEMIEKEKLHKEL